MVRHATISDITRGLTDHAARFFHWWKTGLVACVPSWLRVRVLGAQVWWVLDLDDAGATAKCQTDTGEVLQQLDLSGPDELHRLVEVMGSNASQVVIHVPQAWVLHKSVTLPAAAVRNIQQVLTYELDRLTPFSPNDVYFDYAINFEAGGEGRVEVQLAVIQRFLIDKWIDGVQRESIRTSSITTSGVWTGLNFVRSIGRVADRQKRERSYFRMILAGSALILGVAVFVTPLWQMRSATIRLNSSVVQAKHRSEVVLNLKAQIEDTESALNYVIEQKKSSIPAIEVLDLVTRLLPDDTWVQQLEIKQDSVELRGISEQATRLIKLFEDSPNFTDAAFRSPVLQARNSSRYHMAAKLVVSGVE